MTAVTRAATSPSPTKIGHERRKKLHVRRRRRRVDGGYAMVGPFFGLIGGARSQMRLRCGVGGRWSLRGGGRVCPAAQERKCVLGRAPGFGGVGKECAGGESERNSVQFEPADNRVVGFGRGWFARDCRVRPQGVRKMLDRVDSSPIRSLRLLS